MYQVTLGLARFCDLALTSPYLSRIPGGVGLTELFGRKLSVPSLTQVLGDSILLHPIMIPIQNIATPLFGFQVEYIGENHYG